MRATLPSRFSTRKRQRGVATILIVLFAGFSLSAAVLGVMYRIRGSQEQAVALHAQTQAQIRAWTGAEIVRQYLDGLQQRDELDALVTKLNTADSETGVKPTNVPITLQQADGTTLSGIEAKFTKVDVSGTAPAIWAAVTGITEESSKAEARATLEVVYSLETSTTESTTPGASICAAAPKSALVFNGNVNYTGGSLQILNSNSGLSNVAISGALSICNASTAGIAGCTKGDVSLCGGGIADGTSLWSEGNITITNMSTPRSVSLWARNITLDQEGGSYSTVQAGAFTANVIDTHSALVGTTIVGGTRLTSNNIQPATTNTIVVTLNDGTQYAVPLGSATITSSGLVTPSADDVQKLSGTASLPTSFTLAYTGVDGGAITLKRDTISTLWGNAVTITGWNGSYSQVKSYGDFKINSGTVTKLTGKANLVATNGTYKVHSQWYTQMDGFPTISSGAVAGHLYDSTGTMVGDSVSITNVNVTRNQTGTDPGLPGRPYCDTRTQAVEIDDYRDSANYVFYFDGNTPMLKIQNVKRTDTGASLDGTYNLSQSNYMTSIDSHPFMVCNNQKNSGSVSAMNCFSNASPSNGWRFNGVQYFPTGILWFQGPVYIGQVALDNSAPLYNTLLASGNVTLGNSGGSSTIYAPNFTKSISALCNGFAYPSNVCTKNNGDSALATWTDAAGTVHTGLPLANQAISTEGSLTSESGWTIYGNVTVGTSASFAGATTTIYGAVTVGANAFSSTTVSQGGLKIVLDGLTSDQLYQPSTGCSSSSSTEETSSSHIRILWSRYQ